jgi:S1-C subfamily serine protease
MNMEQLSKSQIVLLTLLVSFVTSIATGIVTVSLMDQAPPIVAQTINRVIERTVEKIVPTGQTASTIITQEKTVVVNESDQIAEAVAKVSVSVVRLTATSADGSAFLGLGIVVGAPGTIVTDSSVLGDSGDASATFSDGTRVRVFVRSRDADNGLAFLEAATSSDVHTPWKPAPVAGGQLTLGKSVVALSGKTIARIADGIVVALMPAKDGTAEVIETNISESLLVAGSPLVDIDGGIVGISTGVSRSASSGGFISAGALLPPPSE